MFYLHTVALKYCVNKKYIYICIHAQDNQAYFDKRRFMRLTTKIAAHVVYRLRSPAVFAATASNHDSPREISDDCDMGVSVKM